MASVSFNKVVTDLHTAWKISAVMLQCPVESSQQGTTGWTLTTAAQFKTKTEVQRKAA